MMIRTLIVDLDNTLYDWLAFFGPAIRGLCSRLSDLSGVPADILYSDFKSVFSRHGSVEYTFAVQELPALKGLSPELKNPELVNKYRDAIDVYQSRRRQYLRLYQGVTDGLRELKCLGISVFALSDARRFHVAHRLKQLGIVDLLDGICCVRDHPVVEEDVLNIRRHKPEKYEISFKQEHILPAGLRKPDPEVLKWLLQRLKLSADDAVYVGDSLVKDIPMAKAAGVYDCWAVYGTTYSVVDMATLVRVTDWPAAAVAAAVDATPEGTGIFPSYQAHSFEDVISLVTKARDEWPPRIGPTMTRQLPLFEMTA